jgi:SMC interacting uncharacterized protein involved in chromosome segregation
MRKKITLTESELHQLIVRIVEQTEGDDKYHHLSPEDYLSLMRVMSNRGNAFKKLKNYKDKPLWIDGDLSVSGLDIKDLGPIAGISGSLDISNTKISNIDGIDVKKYVSKYGSTLQKIEDKRELMAKQGEALSRREDGDWELGNADDVGLKAIALFEWLEGEGKVKTLDEDDKEKLKVLRNKLQELESEYEELDDNDDRAYELQEAIDDTQSEIDEMEEDVADVYDMYPVEKYSHYGLQRFEVLIDGFKDEEYTVGTEEEMDEAALSYAKNYIDDVGVEGFSPGFIDDYLDEDEIVRMAEEDYEYQVRDYPEGYFSDDDYELTLEQEERIEQLESQIEDLEEQRRELDSDDENYYDYEEDLTNQIDTLQEELDGIEIDTEPTEEMIEDKVAELVRDVKRDPMGYLNDLGMEVKNYVDEDALAQGLVDSDGYSIMNSYDGNYDSINISGETYYIMRIN